MSPSLGLTPLDMMMLRHAGAFIVALPIVLWRGLPRVGLRRGAVLTAFAGFGFPYAAYLGFSMAPAADGAVLLSGLLPFSIALVWWIAFGEAPNTRRYLSLALVAAGVALIASETVGAYPGAWRGDLIFPLGGLSWAIYMACVRRWQVSALDATLVVMLLAPIVTLPLWWVFGGDGIVTAPLAPVLMQTVYQGLFAVLLSGFLFTRAMNSIGAETTSTITSLVPGMTALAAWPLLGEPLGAAAMAGLAIVTAGMVLGVTGAR
jgi:drug/metabolite transporter (DMT)-like permease